MSSLTEGFISNNEFDTNMLDRDLSNLREKHRELTNTQKNYKLTSRYTDNCERIKSMENGIYALMAYLAIFKGLGFSSYDKEWEDVKKQNLNVETGANIEASLDFETKKVVFKLAMSFIKPGIMDREQEIAQKTTVISVDGAEFKTQFLAAKKKDEDERK